MKIYIQLVLIVGLFFCGKAVAQTDLTGTWQGKLAAGPTEKVTVQFIFTKQADGSYKALLNSPDTGGFRNVAVDKVQYKDGRLTLEVTSLSGSYSGTVAKDAITGEWRQAGSALPLVLTPYRPPTAATLKPLLGSWVGKIQANPTTALTLVIRFETGKDGKVAGFLDIPDQNAKGLPVTDVNLEGSEVTFKIPVGKADYTGTLKGRAITGSFKQGAQETKLDLARGTYVPPPPEVNIPQEAMQQLLGRWTGKIANLTIVLRFEKNAAGKFAVLMDSPDQKAMGIPVSSATLTKDKLLLKVAAVFGEYNATLSGNKIDGTWTQGGKPMPLVLTKE
jgi:hypothetical protein